MDFSKVLDTKVADVEKPPLAPLGDYVFQITAAPRVSERGIYDIVEFPCVAVEALETVDPEELAEFGDLKNIRTRVSFLFNKEDDAGAATTQYHMTNFLEQHLGCSEDGMTVKQAMGNAINHRFVGATGYRPNKNDVSELFFEIKKTAPVE